MGGVKASGEGVVCVFEEVWFLGPRVGVYALEDKTSIPQGWLWS